MKRFRLALLGALLLFPAAISTSVNAAPASAMTPATESNRTEVKRRCHHNRQTSRQHCTSEQQILRYLPPPRLHYPHRYYGGTPHYAYIQPYYYYGYRPSIFGPYGFYRHRWHRGYYGY